MKVALIAPFLTSNLITLSEFVVNDPHGTRARLAENGLKDWEVLTATSQTQAALIHEHEPVEATLAPRRLLSARQPEGMDPVLWQPGVTAVELAVGIHGTGAVILWCDVDDFSAIEAIETAATAGIGHVAAQVSLAIDVGPAPSTHRVTSGQYPLDTFLWWHRVALVDDRNRDAVEAALLGTSERSLGIGERVVVGDGYSMACNISLDELAAVVRGLVDGQEVWVTGEAGARDVVMQIASLQATASMTNAQLVRAAQNAQVVAENEELRMAVLQDQVRYTTGSRRLALDAAAEAWGMSLELQPVRHHLKSLRDMLERRLDERRLRQERRLSLWLFALAVASGFGLVLATYETAVGLKPDHFPVRIAVASVVAGLMLATLGLLARYFKRQNL